jgi:hypothetical protein
VHILLPGSLSLASRSLLPPLPPLSPSASSRSTLLPTNFPETAPPINSPRYPHLILSPPPTPLPRSVALHHSRFDHTRRFVTTTTTTTSTTHHHILLLLRPATKALIPCIVAAAADTAPSQALCLVGLLLLPLLSHFQNFERLRWVLMCQPPLPTA